MKNIKYLTLLIGVIFSSQIYGQQDVSYTLYQYNMNIINPAYAGINDYSELNLHFKSQWTYLEDSPETGSFLFAFPVNDKIGLGFSMQRDQVFVLEQIDLNIDFSYKIQLSEESFLYLGLKAGGSFVNIDLNSLGVMNDPLFTQNVNRFNPNFGVGAYFKSNEFYFNISAPALLKSEWYEKDASVISKASEELHFYIGTGYTLQLNEYLDFTPSIMSRFVTGSPVSLDITATFDIRKKVELGISYRIDETMSGLALFKIVDWMHFGYAYDRSFSEVGNYNDGSHEVILHFKL